MTQGCSCRDTSLHGMARWGSVLAKAVRSMAGMQANGAKLLVTVCKSHCKACGEKRQYGKRVYLPEGGAGGLGGGGGEGGGGGDGGGAGGAKGSRLRPDSMRV